MPRLCIVAVAAVIVAACDGGPIAQCDPDAGSTPPTIELAPGNECTSRTLAIPSRERTSCGGLPSELAGARVRLVAPRGLRWVASIDRTDGTPSAVCAGVLDPSCACASGECADASERTLELELGTVERDELEIALGAGTYTMQLCAR